MNSTQVSCVHNGTAPSTICVQQQCTLECTGQASTTETGAPSQLRVQTGSADRCAQGSRLSPSAWLSCRYVHRALRSSTVATGAGWAMSTAEGNAATTRTPGGILYCKLQQMPTPIRVARRCSSGSRSLHSCGAHVMVQVVALVGVQCSGKESSCVEPCPTKCVEGPASTLPGAEQPRSGDSEADAEAGRDAYHGVSRWERSTL